MLEDKSSVMTTAVLNPCEPPPGLRLEFSVYHPHQYASPAPPPPQKPMPHYQYPALQPHHHLNHHHLEASSFPTHSWGMWAPQVPQLTPPETSPTQGATFPTDALLHHIPAPPAPQTAPATTYFPLTPPTVTAEQHTYLDCHQMFTNNQHHWMQQQHQHQQHHHQQQQTQPPQQPESWYPAPPYPGCWPQAEAPSVPAKAKADAPACTSSVAATSRSCRRCRCPNCVEASATGEKRKIHVCHFPGCDKAYSKTSHLKAHLRWHLGDKPYACHWMYCNRRFTRADELQRHLRTHTGEKRFACATCDKKFTRSDHLSKHLKTHSGSTGAKTPSSDSNDSF